MTIRSLFLALAGFCLALCALSASAGVPTIVLNSDGTAYFSSGNGTPAIKIENIVRLPGSGDVPVPPDVTPDDDPPSSDIAHKIEQWTAGLDDPVGANLLGEAYKFVGTKIADGTIPTNNDDVNAAFKLATNKAIELIPEKDRSEWKEVDQKITQELTIQLLNSGGKLTRLQWSEFLTDAGNALLATSQGTALPDWLQPLIDALIAILIEFINSRFGGGS
ncbi:hypothetical protein KOR42_45100 [Thalassoglobus neptunius]|uniref:Secreted protein n=1 Tax=Thalassoglobus neptunius TaxID=1938619 RepID=A0A5C5VXA3_9PLAN|nr:hypothetical protein [Thalassoglobus neptunius]TWT43050.1 hypothetical protein KOR42_45100 [Thalassoglobus neptunius]